MQTELESLLDRLPSEVMESFTSEQRAALWQASKPMTWRRHPINLRLTTVVPLLGHRYFLTVVGGMEKRDHGRVVRERRMFPLRTAGNTLFLLGLGGTLCAAALLGIFMFSNLIEF